MRCTSAMLLVAGLMLASAVGDTVSVMRSTQRAVVSNLTSGSPAGPDATQEVVWHVQDEASEVPKELGQLTIAHSTGVKSWRTCCSLSRRTASSAVRSSSLCSGPAVAER
jgi:hypothetical protein